MSETELGAAADALAHDESGQTMAEYGVVLGVITLAVVGAFLLLGTEIRSVITDVIGRLRG